MSACIGSLHLSGKRVVRILRQRNLAAAVRERNLDHDTLFRTIEARAGFAGELDISICKLMRFDLDFQGGHFIECIVFPEGGECPVRHCILTGVDRIRTRSGHFVFARVLDVQNVHVIHGAEVDFLTVDCDLGGIQHRIKLTAVYAVFRLQRHIERVDRLRADDPFYLGAIHSSLELGDFVVVRVHSQSALSRVIVTRVIGGLHFRVTLREHHRAGEGRR